MNKDISEIESETESVGRIYMEELQSDPDIIKKKVNEKIMLILAKYGYTYEITEFAWVNGQIQATIDIVKIPENITEK